MARAAQLRGVAPVQASSSSSSRSTDSLAVASRTDDDVVLLLERAKDSKSALRSEYLQKWVACIARTALCAGLAWPQPAISLCDFHQWQHTDA